MSNNGVSNRNIIAVSSLFSINGITYRCDWVANEDFPEASSGDATAIARGISDTVNVLINSDGDVDHFARK